MKTALLAFLLISIPCFSAERLKPIAQPSSPKIELLEKQAETNKVYIAAAYKIMVELRQAHEIAGEQKIERGALQKRVEQQEQSYVRLVDAGKKIKYDITMERERLRLNQAEHPQTETKTPKVVNRL